MRLPSRINQTWQRMEELPIAITPTELVSQLRNPKCNILLKHRTIKEVPNINKRRRILVTITKLWVQRVTANNRSIRYSSSTNRNTTTCGLESWYVNPDAIGILTSLTGIPLAYFDVPRFRRGIRTISSRVCREQDWKRRERYLQQSEQFLTEHQYHHSLRFYSRRCVRFLMALLYRRTCLHEAVYLDYRHSTYRLWGRNGHLLLLSPLLFSWNSLRPI